MKWLEKCHVQEALIWGQIPTWMPAMPDIPPLNKWHVCAESFCSTSVCQVPGGP